MYYSKDEIKKAKQIDLYTYLTEKEPDEIIPFSRGTYITREHDSLKISNGMWYWFSKGVGGKSALDYLIIVKGYSFTEAMNTILNYDIEIPKYEFKNKKIMPTLSDLKNELLKQPEKEGQELALCLELYSDGSLDTFSHQTNVNTNSRLINYNIHNLGKTLKTFGLLVITDAMINRVNENYKKGKRTHIFIDEIHVLFSNEYSSAFFNSAWRQFRKRNAYPTAITQNVSYLLASVDASTMLSNSEFIVMLNQAAQDREKLSKLLNISEEQLSYITNSKAGHGLIRYGSSLVPFINEFPKDTKLYKLMTTKPGE